MAWHVRATRIAISPRFAMRTRRNTDVAMPPADKDVVRVTAGCSRAFGAGGGPAPAGGDARAMLLLLPREEPGDIDEGHEREIERVAESDEPRAFDRGVDVERPRQVSRLVSDDAHRLAVEAGEPDDDVSRPRLVDLE